MGLVDYEVSSSSDEEEVTHMKQAHYPPSVMTSTSKKPPTKKGEKKQLTANFFLPPKMQAALLSGDISSDSDDESGVGAKISVKQRGAEKGLLDILPAPNSSNSKGRGGGLGEAAAKLVAARNEQKAKEGRVIDSVVEEENDEEEEEEEEQQQGSDIISCVKEEIGLKGQVRKANVMSQPVASLVVENPTNSEHKEQPHASIHVSTSSTSTTPWSSYPTAVYAATEAMPTVRNEITTPVTTVQQPSVLPYYNNSQCRQQEEITWENNNQGGNSRPGKKKRNLDRMLASGNLQALEQQTGVNVQVTNLQGYDTSNFDITSFDSRQNPGATKAEGTKLQRRKHQINTLAAHANAMERELLDNAGRGKLTKAQTQAKYGW